jgi:hypothetical protein
MNVIAPDDVLVARGGGGDTGLPAGAFQRGDSIRPLRASKSKTCTFWKVAAEGSFSKNLLRL